MSASVLLAEVRLLLAKLDQSAMGRSHVPLYVARETRPLRALVEAHDSGKLCDDCFGPAICDNGMPCRCGDNS